MKKLYTILIAVIAITVTGLSQHNSTNRTQVNTNHNINHHHHDNHHHDSEKKEYKVKFSSGTLELIDIDALKIVTTKGNEVMLETYIEDHDQHERSRGLKALNAAGLDDNTGLGISAKQEGGSLKLSQISNSCDCHELKVYVPEGVKINISGNGASQADDIYIDGIPNEIVISTVYQAVNLKNVTGPMAIKTVYGDVEASFSNVSQNGSISIDAVYGLVDVSIPGSTNADVQLSAPYGDIYSDMEVQVSTEGSMKSLSGRRVKGKLNSGGVSISLKSSYENIYLRKK